MHPAKQTVTYREPKNGRSLETYLRVTDCRKGKHPGRTDAPSATSGQCRDPHDPSTSHQPYRGTGAVGLLYPNGIPFELMWEIDQLQPGRLPLQIASSAQRLTVRQYTRHSAKLQLRRFAVLQWEPNTTAKARANFLRVGRQAEIGERGQLSMFGTAACEKNGTRRSTK